MAQFQVLIDGSEPEGGDGRVSWSLNSRIFRYYRTLGLLDRPTTMVGRTGYYGTKHLLQLMAIKKLQREGHGLHEIQARLYGLDAQALEGFLDLPASWPNRLAPPQGPAAGLEPTKRFWDPPESPLRQWVELELIPGVRLQVDPERVGGLDRSRQENLRRVVAEFFEEGPR